MAENMEDVDTFENDVKYANKDEDPPDPGVCRTSAVSAGGGDFSQDILDAKSDLGLIATNLELCREHSRENSVGIQLNKKETLENEEDDEMDTLLVSDTGASEDCRDVMHKMEVDGADEVVEIDDASPYLEEDDDSS